MIGLLFAACEPLDIQLFPVRIDAGAVTQPDDAANAEPPMNAAPDAPREGGTPCLPGATRCQDCVALELCSAGQRCHPVTGQCMTPCGPALTDCPGSDVCNEELGVCVSCIDDSACTDDDEASCDPLQGICVECTDDSDCTDDPLERPICLPGLNFCGCETGDDCASGSCELPDAKCDDEEEEDDN